MGNLRKLSSRFTWDPGIRTLLLGHPRIWTPLSGNLDPSARASRNPDLYIWESEPFCLGLWESGPLYLGIQTPLLGHLGIRTLLLGLLGI